MRFNKHELAALALNSSIHFDKEGVLIITERQENFFRKTEVSLPRWCKLRGNLLFYLSDCESSSKPDGVLVLENCRPLIHNEKKEYDGFAFILEFEHSLPQRISAQTNIDRLDWIKCIQLASYSYLDKQIRHLKSQIALAMGNRIERGMLLDSTINSASSSSIKNTSTSDSAEIINKWEEGAGLPLWESALTCNNLPTSESGRLPNSKVVCSILTFRSSVWRYYARTEIVENSLNPQYICTMRFRKCKDLREGALVRFTVYDVKERFSGFPVPIGYAEIALKIIQNTTHLCIPLYSCLGNSSLTITSWLLDTQNNQIQLSSCPPLRLLKRLYIKRLRRSVSLPSRVSNKPLIPLCTSLKKLFVNPTVHTYRLQSDINYINICEEMFESKLSYIIPEQLLAIWILREKELLLEITSMGKLSGTWGICQMDVIDKHLTLLKRYSQVQRVLQDRLKEGASYFKRSSDKDHELLEFVPVNLHLQRMWAQGSSVHKRRLLDITTVGAFTKHSSTYKQTGGLISLLKNNTNEYNIRSKVQITNDAVEVIKQIRNNIVEIMSELLVVGKSKLVKQMMVLSNSLADNIKVLLNVLESTLVEEALSFLKQNRTLEQTNNVMTHPAPSRFSMLPLSDMELKLGELKNCYINTSVNLRKFRPCTNSAPTYKMLKSCSLMDLRCRAHLHSKNSVNCMCSEWLENDWKIIHAAVNQRGLCKAQCDHQFCQLMYSTSHEEMLTQKFSQLSTDIHNSSDVCSKNMKMRYNILRYEDESLNRLHFLDTKTMNCSHSANYYKSQEEPQSLDSIRLNIEGTVMCLRSKIKSFNECNDNAALYSRHSRGISLPNDWTSELRPYMRKLRNAIDSLLKTAHVVHSVNYVQQGVEKISADIEIMYRRNVCFSQALTSVISALMAKLWSSEITEEFVTTLHNIGPLAYFEGLLSLHGSEKDMWGDMCIAIEDMHSVDFILVNSNFETTDCYDMDFPHISSSRQSITVYIPGPESVFTKLLVNSAIHFKINPIFFNVGINEKATIAETFGQTKEQQRSNWDNYVRLKQYYEHFHKLTLDMPDKFSKYNSKDLFTTMNELEKQFKNNVSKNVKILHLAERACCLMSGLRFTSCKSAKDRTGMATTLEQCRFLEQEFELPSNIFMNILTIMRSEGTRMDNVCKNIGKRKYAFNSPQCLALPVLYRPPPGCYGKADT